MSKLKSKTVWYGEYKGVSFEIQNFSRDYGKEDCWTYYLYINLDRLSEVVADRFWLKPEKDKHGNRYEYYSEGLISNIDWHCGCTFYEKRRGFDGDPKVVKIGCDYQHYWDEGMTYDVSYVERDVKAAIDSFLDMVPYKLRCGYCGEVVDKSKMSYWGEGYICDSCNDDPNKEKSNVGSRVGGGE